MNTTDANFLRQKIINAQTAEEALALIQLANSGHQFPASASVYPIAWHTDIPLCRHCWMELAGENGFCSLCQAVFDQIEGSDSRIGAAILVLYQYAEDIFNAFSDSSPEWLAPISENELLILLPPFKVAGFLFFLHETAPHPSALISIVFPAHGDMAFGDAIAMARYFANSVQSFGGWFSSKFFFNYSHMRAFDFGDVLPFEITAALFETAAAIKKTFSREDRSVISELLKKDPVNRVYEMNRFYSMCNPEQKSLLNRINVEGLDPKSALLLFQLVRYVEY